jgi:hypothetical protein
MRKCLSAATAVVLAVTLAEKYVFSDFSNWSVDCTPWALDVKLAH